TQFGRKSDSSEDRTVRFQSDPFYHSRISVGPFDSETCAFLNHPRLFPRLSAHSRHRRLVSPVFPRTSLAPHRGQEWRRVPRTRRGTSLRRERRIRRLEITRARG